jgi:hypothetical protein
MQPNSGTYDIFLFLFVISLIMLAGFGIVTIFISVAKKRKKENIEAEPGPLSDEPVISSGTIQPIAGSQKPS